MIGSSAGPAGIICARAGCGAAAAFNVNWRNPRIHTPERVKIWPACAEHRAYLAGYLETRGFPVEVTPVGETVARVGNR